MYEPKNTLLKCAKECTRFGYRVEYTSPTWNNRKKILEFTIRGQNTSEKVWKFKNKNKSILRATQEIYEWIGKNVD